MRVPRARSPPAREASGPFGPMPEAQVRLRPWPVSTAWMPAPMRGRKPVPERRPGEGVRGSIGSIDSLSFGAGFQLLGVGPGGRSCRRTRTSSRLRARRRLLIAGVDEGLRDERGGDRLSCDVGQRTDLQVLDVDDSGETAHPIEEEREVVVGPVQRYLDRVLRVELPCDRIGGRELFQAEVALTRQ